MQGVAMKLTLHHVNLCSNDVSQLTSFYEQILDMQPVPSLSENRNKDDAGYHGDVSFITDGTTQFHLAQRDLGAAFRAGQHINPLTRGHIAFRTDDIAAFKKRLDDKGIPYADYGGWAMNGWHQIFFYDPDGNIVEVHEASE